MTVRDATPHPPAAEDQEDQHRLTALEGLAALSLDALSSVAYGPQAIVIVLAAAGTVGLGYTVPVTIAIVVLLAVLVISYRQVIEAFPNGGGAYAVAKRHLGRYASLTAGASLTVDYVLNAAVGVSAGVEAFTSAFPNLYPDRVWICLGVLAIITAANMWGVAESARLFIVPTLIFIASIAIVIAGGLIRTHPAVPPSGHLPAVAESVGILLLLKAFASGCSALTGVEAIANAVPQFRQPRARRAQHTEVMLGIILGLMLIGIAVLIRKFHVAPSPTETTLAQLTAAAVGHNILFYAIQLITTVLLALAANTSFGGLPVLASLLARDNFLPHMFALKAERSVFRYGVGVLAVFAAVLLVVSKGDTQKLIPVFAIGVFVGFTLSQAGMVKHWHEQHTDGWVGRAFINGLGAVLTTIALGIELVSKFTEGAWLVVIVIPLVVLLFRRIHRAYGEIGMLLELGKTPDPPERTAGAGRGAGARHVPADPGGDLRRPVPGGRRRRGDDLLRRPRRRASYRAFPCPVGGMEPGRAAGHAAHPAPLPRAPGGGVPAGPGSRRSAPPGRGGDPRGPAHALVAVVPAQPARFRAQPGHHQRHQQRGGLPAPVPAGVPGAGRGPRRRPGQPVRHHFGARAPVTVLR